MDIIARQLPETDKPHLASAFEYQKIDGFHSKPLGADLMLQQMKEEEEEEKRSKP